MRTEYGSQTNKGRVRSSNEDSVVVRAETGLFLVADGMGGHAAGEVASHLTAATIDDWVTAHAADAKAPGVFLQAALEANARVFEAQRKDRALAGMGSTLTAMLFRDGRYLIAHVGDSRAYRLREGNLSQLTRDHSIVWHLYENGVLAKAELSRHPQKNLITRSIGSHPQVEVDIEEGETLAGDTYLLCSDGLTDGVSDDELRTMLSDTRKSPQNIADDLVDAANRAGGPDNISVVVIRMAENRE